MARGRLADLQGPRGTKMDHFGPFGFPNAKNRFGIRSFYILVQFTFQQYRGHSLIPPCTRNSLSLEKFNPGSKFWFSLARLSPKICLSVAREGQIEKNDPDRKFHSVLRTSLFEFGSRDQFFNYGGPPSCVRKTLQNRAFWDAMLEKKPDCFGKLCIWDRAGRKTWTSYADLDLHKMQENSGIWDGLRIWKSKPAEMELAEGHRKTQHVKSESAPPSAGDLRSSRARRLKGTSCFTKMRQTEIANKQSFDKQISPSKVYL